MYFIIIFFLMLRHGKMLGVNKMGPYSGQASWLSLELVEWSHVPYVSHHLTNITPHGQYKRVPCLG